MAAIVLVEGITDELALTLAAGRSGRDLTAEGVTIIGTNGAQGLARVLRQIAAEHPAPTVAGLYDAGEEPVVRAALERAGLGRGLDRSRLERLGFFACDSDLEEELTRAAGDALISRLIELEGDSQAWRTFRKQRPWQGRPADEQFRRFIRSVSDRNSRYIRRILESIDPNQLPRPLVLLLDYLASRP